ncbi:MAG: hypothetical protein STSR0009_16940 [Methanoregula sp.]
MWSIKSILLLGMLCLITMSVSAASVITAPTGTFQLGETKDLPVTVAGLDKASGVNFNMTYDQGLFYVDAVTASSSYPNAAVTTNVDNTTGLIQVAVTDTDGITATGATPLVDITFRNRGGSGTTAVTIPNAYWSDSEGASALMSGDGLNAFDPYQFDAKVAGALEAKSSVQSEIRVGTGVLSSGGSVRVPISVANVTSVNNISIGMNPHHGLMFNGTRIVIEDVVINESAPVGTVIVTDDTWIANEGWGTACIHIQSPNITASGLTPVVDLVVRPTDWTGTETLTLMGYHCSYSTPSSSFNQFALVNNGQVVTNGGGAQPGDGEIRFLDTSIEGASTAKYPIEVKLPAGAKNVFTPFYYNSTFYTVTALAINATTNTTYGAYLCESELYSGEGWVKVANTQGLPTNEFTPLIDVNFKTFAQYGSTPFSLSKYYGPSYVVSSPGSHIVVSYPFRTVTHGNVNVTPAKKPDLVGEIIDAPKFVKKYKDDSLHFNTTFAVHNIGYSDVTNDFEIQGRLGNTTQKIDITDDIPAHQTLMMYMKMNVIPNLPETEVKVLSQGLNKYYTINTSGDIGVGSFNIGIGIDVNNAVGEVNETNNDVNTTAPITRPDLIPTSYVQFVSSSGSTVVNSFEAPGTYTINYGVKNMGDVFAVPTSMNVTIAGTKKIYDVPVLQPGAMYNLSQSIQITKTSSPDINVVVNANRSEAELNYNNNTYSTSYQSIKPVTINLPRTNGTTEFDRTVNITLTNVTTTITDITFPFRYDPTVCYVSSITGLAPGISASQSYGRVVFTGTSLGISSNATIGQVNLRARTNDGRSATLTSDTSAIIKTESTKQLDLIINSGTYNQVSITDARLSVWVPTKGPVNNNQTISLSVYNYRSNTVFVNVNVTVDGVMIWQNPNMSLSSYQSRYINIPTWKPTIAKKYWVNATLTGDDLPVGNTSQASILIEDFQLNITDQNKQYWERYYGYNKTVFLNTDFWIGTYYSSNQGSMVNGTVRIWDEFGNLVSNNEQTFKFSRYYPPFEQWYGYNSDWNYMAWYSIQPKKIGIYYYNITLDSRGKVTVVNGTIIVKEPYVDIKVVNSTSKNETQTETTLLWDIFVNGSSINKQTVIKVAAGTEGRTIQGLTYLDLYPYACPEQTMSPTLANLRMLEYYENREGYVFPPGAREQYIEKIKKGVDIMSAPLGYNAQQQARYDPKYGDGKGGWAWGKNSQSSMFYTLYPEYVLSEVYLSNTTEWAPSFRVENISFNESVKWLINKQQVTKNANNGSWQESGYIYNSYIWTGWCMVKFDNEYDLLSVDMKEKVNWSMRNASYYLTNLPSSGSLATNDARAFAIMGLVGIKHRIGDDPKVNVTKIDEKIAAYTAQLRASQADDGYWNGGGYWYVNKDYTTAQVLKALNATGILSTDPQITKGIRYLVGIYNSGGRWSNTATTAGVLEALIQLQPDTYINGTADISVYTQSGILVNQTNHVPFDNSKANLSHSIPLSPDELTKLYSGSYGKWQARVVLTNWTKTDPKSDDVQLLVSVDSRMQLPITIANKIIEPKRYIDPIAENFTLEIAVPEAKIEGEIGDVNFTIHNLAGTDTQSVMIVNVPANSGGIEFIGDSDGSNKAYYYNYTITPPEKVFLTHKYNTTDKTVAFFPGSDDESLSCIPTGESKSFYLPLKFNSAGNVTVQARAYPMYNDELMALGNGSAYVNGFGNITLEAINQVGVPVMTANFFIDNVVVNTNTNITTNKTPEGSHTIAIQNASSWVNITLSVGPGDTTTYSAQFVDDTTIPHVASVEGGGGNVRLNYPTINETISNSTLYPWNAVVIAMKSFNSSLSNKGGLVTIEVDIPTVMNRATSGLNKTYVNESIPVYVRTSTGWYQYMDNTTFGSILRINHVNTNDVEEIVIGFDGKMLGDVNSNPDVNIIDAKDIAWSTVGTSLEGNKLFYGDVNMDGVLNIMDAKAIAWFTVGSLDKNYQ